jgi:hypothetical protein
LIDLDGRDDIYSLEKNLYVAPSVLWMAYADAVVVFNLSFPSAHHIGHSSASDKDGTCHQSKGGMHHSCAECLFFHTSWCH